jgi:O-antigen/teichoic acid export membrane protein
VLSDPGCESLSPRRGVLGCARLNSPSRLAQPAAAPREHPGVLARNAFHLLLGQVASTALSIGLSAALGRTLGPADFGVYFLLLSMSTFAYVFVDWGQSALLVREAAKRPDAIGELLGSALAFRTAVALAAVVVTALLARVIGYPPRTQALAALVVLCALPLGLSQPYGYLFRGRDRMDLDAGVTVAAKALTVAVTVAALLLGGRLASAILAQGLGGLGALAVALYLGTRIGLPRPRASWAMVRELGSEGTAIAVFFVAIAVQPYIDAVVLSKLAPAVVVGFYGAARNIIGVLIAPATILAGAAFPQLSRAAGNLPELHRVMRTALRPLLGLGALGGVGCFLFAPVAVAVIYGPGRYDPAVDILQLFAPALFFVFFDMLLATAATAVGKTRALAVAKLLSVVVSTVLAILLVPLCQARFGNGGLGIVIAFSASELVMLVACSAVLPRGTLDRSTLLDLGRALLAGAGTLLLFRLLPPFTPWVGIPACIAAFALLSLTVGLVNRNDVSNLSVLFRRR